MLMNSIFFEKVYAMQSIIIWICIAKHCVPTHSEMKINFIKKLIFKKINFFVYSIRMLQSFTESENNLKFFSKNAIFYVFIFRAAGATMLLLMKIGCVYLCSKQCDQMVRLFFKFGHLQSMKISPILSQICLSKLSILPNKK